MKNTPIVFRVDQGPHHVVFSLRQMTARDDSEFLQGFIGIADEAENADAVYKIKSEFLAKLATPFPEGVKLDGKKAARPDDCLDTPEAIQAFFADATVDKDWVSEKAVDGMRAQHSPTVSFFTVSAA